MILGTVTLDPVQPARMDAEIIQCNAKYELGKDKITLYIYHTWSNIL